MPRRLVDPVAAAVAACWSRTPDLPRRLLVAVSGGPDSMALWHAVRLWAGPRSIPLTIAHVHHGLRGHEADGDAALVAATAAAWGDDFRLLRLDPATLFGPATNLEATARRQRYAWFAELAREQSADQVLTGHTADDQAETVLFHVLRGTGWRGLRGVARRRRLAPGLWLRRPLLSCTRAEILAYNAAHAVPYRHDSSNTDPRYTRNRLRHVILPLLTEHVNHQAVRHLASLARLAQTWQRHRERWLDRVLDRAQLPSAGATWILNRGLLARRSPSLLRELCVRLWERAGWNRTRMTRARWHELAQLIGQSRGALDLPHGLRAEVTERVVRLIPRTG